MITVLDVLAARRRLAPYLTTSPLRHSAWLSDHCAARVYLKLESVQLTSSFKIRGAFNAALRLREGATGARDRPRIVTASAGNHGRALALAGELLGLGITVFTPRNAPATKRAAIRRHGADLRDDFADYDSAETAARQFAAESSAEFVSPYNHADVMTGAGTVALEILEALPALDALIVPLGGGGLASGLGTVIKAGSPRGRIVGVEAANSTPFAQSIRAGRIVHVNAGPSLADGLTGNLEADALTFDIVRRLVDEFVTVDEAEIAMGVDALAREEHLIAEGAGAVATAAVLARDCVKPGETAVVMVTGANIDLETLTRLLSSGGKA